MLVWTSCSSDGKASKSTSKCSTVLQALLLNMRVTSRAVSHMQHVFLDWSISEAGQGKAA